MAVIINDFEVVAEPPPAEEPSGEAQEGQSGDGKGLTPREIERIIERQCEREARLWAH